jgi:hypothetical protein
MRKPLAQAIQKRNQSRFAPHEAFGVTVPALTTCHLGIAGAM